MAKFCGFSKLFTFLGFETKSNVLTEIIRLSKYKEIFESKTKLYFDKKGTILISPIFLYSAALRLFLILMTPISLIPRLFLFQFSTIYSKVMIFHDNSPFVVYLSGVEVSQTAQFVSTADLFRPTFACTSLWCFEPHLPSF